MLTLQYLVLFVNIKIFINYMTIFLNYSLNSHV